MNTVNVPVFDFNKVGGSDGYGVNNNEVVFKLITLKVPAIFFTIALFRYNFSS